MKSDIKRQIQENLNRVTSLVKVYEDVAGQGRGRRGASKVDVLRAAVVLLHASLEEFLRSIERLSLKKSATKDVLNDIGFSGSRRKNEKIPLGYLLDHKGKTVDEFIDKSVEAHLDSSNYNNICDIANLLDAIGFDKKKVNSHFGKIEEMISRRHLIVHQADRDDTGGHGKHRVRSIGTNKVNEWVKAVKDFCNTILSNI